MMTEVRPDNFGMGSFYLEFSVVSACELSAQQEAAFSALHREIREVAFVDIFHLNQSWALTGLVASAYKTHLQDVKP